MGFDKTDAEEGVGGEGKERGNEAGGGDDGTQRRVS